MPVLDIVKPGLAQSNKDLNENDRLKALLRELYARQLAQGTSEQERVYLESHRVPNFIMDQVSTFQWYRPHLPESGAILDWGCRHAPDSCLLRAVFGDRYELHGCDFWQPGLLDIFHDFAGLQYTQLTTPFELPYEDNTFDTVIGAGVLEHVALEHDALRQLYRILKPGGKLIIYYLPNRWSLQEWRARTFHGKGHRRLYTLGGTRTKLKEFGFWPLQWGYQDIHFWENRLRLFGRGPRVVACEKRLARLFPLRLFCTTIRLIAVKMQCL